MLLNGEQIIAKNIIDFVGPQSVREASYDLRIGTVLAKPFDSSSTPAKSGEPSKSVVSAEEYELPPQGMVEVISLERVNVPSDVLGYATVKTFLSDRCVLALGIGLIDPGYNSYVSSTLVNFGTQPFLLKRGNVFLRTTFQTYELSGPVATKRRDFDEYLQDKVDKVLTRFSRKFLNLGGTIDDALRLGWAKYWVKILEWSALVALVVTITTAAITVGISVIGSRFVPAPDSQLQDLRSDYRKLQDQNAKLQDQNATTEKELQQVRQALEEMKNRMDSKHPKN